MKTCSYIKNEKEKKKTCFGHWSVFVQEMGDHVKAESVWGIVTQTISSLVLICDAKAWSSKKEDETVSATGLSCMR